MIMATPAPKNITQVNETTLGISCLTNYAAGITSSPLSHKEVIETADTVKNQFSELVLNILLTVNTN